MEDYIIVKNTGFYNLTFKEITALASALNGILLVGIEHSFSFSRYSLSIQV